MDQLRKLLHSLSLQQKISIGIALVLVGSGLIWLISWHKESDFRPLYTAMAVEDAGRLLNELKESGVEYRLADNGTTVLVPSAHLDELRLNLASAGLPKTGRMGFEIFDRSQFGTTDFAEHINYRRAVEGELERTIMALDGVDRARVHITFPKDSVFAESRQPAKASVLLDIRGPHGLSQGSTNAVRYLIASAVEGLDPDAVSVVDRRGRLLSQPRPESEDWSAPPDTMLDYRERLERTMLAKLNRALDPVLGPTRYRAGITVECELTTAEESEETVDPTQSVMVTMQKSEEKGSQPVTGGVPGTASNLPNAEPNVGTVPDSTRRTENATFQTSRKVRHVKQPKGAIRRISVAVLIDHVVRWEQNGEEMERILEAPPPERMQAIQEVAATVVGLKPERGDLITVEALPFEMNGDRVPPDQANDSPGAEPPPSGFWGWLNGAGNIMRVGIPTTALLLVTVLFLVFRRFGRRPNASVGRRAANPLPEGLDSTFLKGAEGTTNDDLEAQTLKALAAASQTGDGMATIVEALRRAVEKDSATAAGIVRSWIVERR